MCPAGLRDTWARELRERFNITAAVLDQASIAERIAALPPGVSPWSGHAVAIASIDFVKRPEVLSAIDGEPIDLVIADEAHHLAPGTDRGAAVSRLASRAPWCVFVSATPHSGDRAAFDYLTSMGAAGDPIAIFRRRRSDVGLAVSRRSHVLRVRPTDRGGGAAGRHRSLRAGDLDRARPRRPRRAPDCDDDGAAGGVLGRRRSRARCVAGWRC